MFFIKFFYITSGLGRGGGVEGGERFCFGGWGLYWVGGVVCWVLLGVVSFGLWYREVFLR